MDVFIYILDIVGTVTFAITGARAAANKKVDLFGVIVLGVVTALGGGTLRDVVLGVDTVFWIADPEYLAYAVCGAIATFLFSRACRMPRRFLLVVNAIGLSVFTIIGFEEGLHATGSYTVGIVMGMASGVAGGMIRDILLRELPIVFRSELYASACLAGGCVYTISLLLSIQEVYALTMAFIVTLAMRLSALYWHLYLPFFSPKDG